MSWQTRCATELPSSLATLSGATSFKVRMSWVLAHSCWHRRIRLIYFIETQDITEPTYVEFFDILSVSACLSSMKFRQTVHNHPNLWQIIKNNMPAMMIQLPRQTHAHKHTVLSCAWCYRYSNYHHYHLSSHITIKNIQKYQHFPV